MMDRDSSVGTATRYGLDRPGMESRWGMRFSASVQTDPGAHQTSCTMGNFFFFGGKVARGVALITHPLVLGLKEEYSYTSTCRLGLKGLF